MNKIELQQKHVNFLYMYPGANHSIISREEKKLEEMKLEENKK